MADGKKNPATLYELAGLLYDLLRELGNDF